MLEVIVQKFLNLGCGESAKDVGKGERMWGGGSESLDM
jgi:hypothetical protein